MPGLTLLATLRAHTGPVWSVSWSPRGLLASCGVDRHVHVWNNESNSEWSIVATSPSDAFLRAVRDVAWSPDGRSIAAASFDATATVLGLVGGPKPLLEPAVCLEGHEAEVKSVAYSSGGGLLATCSRDRSVWIWQVGLDFDYDCVAVLSSHRGDVKRVVWHPHVEMLLSCGFDQSIRVWVEDEDDWFCSEELVAHSSTVWDVCFDPTGNSMASVSANGSLIVWNRESPSPNIEGGTPRFVVAARVSDVCSEPLYSVDWCPNQPLIAAGGGDDSIYILARSDNSSVHPEKPEEHNISELNGTDDSSTTRLTEQWKIVCKQDRAHTGDVNYVSWNPMHPSLIASCGDDGLIRIWRYDPS